MPAGTYDERAERDGSLARHVPYYSPANNPSGLLPGPAPHAPSPVPWLIHEGQQLPGYWPSLFSLLTSTRSGLRRTIPLFTRGDAIAKQIVVNLPVQEERK